MFLNLQDGWLYLYDEIMDPKRKCVLMADSRMLSLNPTVLRGHLLMPLPPINAPVQKGLSPDITVFVRPEAKYRKAAREFTTKLLVTRKTGVVAVPPAGVPPKHVLVAAQRQGGGAGQSTPDWPKITDTHSVMYSFVLTR